MDVIDEVLDLAEWDITRQAESIKGEKRTWTVLAVVEGSVVELSIQATTGSDRFRQMAKAGIDDVNDPWAAGYVSQDRSLVICGNEKSAPLQQELRLRLTG